MNQKQAYVTHYFQPQKTFQEARKCFANYQCSD